MNNVKKAPSSIDFYVFLLLVLSIPFHFRITSSIFILWVATWLVQKIFVEKNKSWFKLEGSYQKPTFFIAILYYVFLAVSLLWSSNINIGLHTLETKLALLFVPLVLVNSSDSYDRGKELVCKSFVGGLLLTSLACLVYSIAASFDSFPTFNPGANFYYTTFSKFSHPSYFSMFITLGILILKLKLVKFKKNETLVSYALIVFFLLILFFLSSKAGIFITYLILFSDIAIGLFKKRTYKKSIVELFFLGVFFLLTITLNARKPVSSITDKTNFESPKLQEDKHYNSTASRVVIWESALDVYLNNILIGVGIGDLKPELFKEFEKRNFRTGIERKYNAHNQYLEDGLNAGMLANLALLLLFLIPFVKNVKIGNLLVAYFIAIIALNFLFESMLEKQNGVMFFAIFYSFFVFVDRK